MHYFIGLTFYQHYLQFKKIDSFRRRFDPKFHHNPLLQMTLLPPFKLSKIDTQAFKEITEHIEEVLDNHLMGVSEIGEVEFGKIDFHMGRTGMLYLKPLLPVDLFHCRESIQEVLESYGAEFKKQKVRSGDSDLEVYLPIGRFSHPELLESAVEVAREEFSLPFHMSAKNIVLFEKTPGQWLQKKRLFNFMDQNLMGERNSHDLTDFRLS